MELPTDRNHTGRTLGAEEIAAVTLALESGVLTSTAGSFTKGFEQKVSDLFGAQAYACSSGTAAIHVAIAAINPEPGDEIITTAITDMGALTPILYQGAIPVFADVDPKTYNLTADSIKQRITSRTKAIIVTHLFGHPCDMTGIMALADSHQIPVIEDCAQAFMARHDGQLLGTFGQIGCFSLQQGKHITTGEGGFVVSANTESARHMKLFINKAWGYGDENPDHYFLALNYRMSELQGAVATAQFDKLSRVVNARIATANALHSAIEDLPGVAKPVLAAHELHTYWKFPLGIDEGVVPGGAVALARELSTRNIASAPRYIQKPAFECAVIRDQNTLGSSRFPFTLASADAVDYSAERYPGTYQALREVLVLPWNEEYEPEHVTYVADSLRESIHQLTQGAQ